MPILQYKCENCNREFEELVKSCDCKVKCPECGMEAKRSWSGEIFSATGKLPKRCSGNCKTCSGCK